MTLDELREAVARQLDAKDPAAEMAAQGLSGFQTEVLTASKAFKAIRSGTQVGRRSRRRNASKSRIER